MKKPELLAPAGTYEKAKIAFMYGADAVYCGTSKHSLRTRTAMDFSDLKNTVNLAHSLGKRVHVAVNVYARDDEYESLIEEIKEVPKNKSYLANKKNFSLYWYLEAVYVLAEGQNLDEDYIKILDICSRSDEYTIREKCAKIVSKFKNHSELKDILQRLQNDENFYVLQWLKN